MAGGGMGMRKMDRRNGLEDEEELAGGEMGRRRMDRWRRNG